MSMSAVISANASAGKFHTLHKYFTNQVLSYVVDKCEVTLVKHREAEQIGEQDGAQTTKRSGENARRTVLQGEASEVSNHGRHNMGIGRVLIGQAPRHSALLNQRAPASLRLALTATTAGSVSGMRHASIERSTSIYWPNSSIPVSNTLNSCSLPMRSAST